MVFPPRSRFRSLTMTHLYNEMPTAHAEVAAALQYSRAVWGATLLGSAKPRHEGFDLPGIRAAWEAVERTAGEFIDVDHPNPRKRRRWGRTRGPIAAALLELHRAGWTVKGPFSWTDDMGTDVTLTETPPALLKAMLLASIRRQAERAMGSKWAQMDEAFKDKRLCIDAAVDAVKRSKTLSPMQRGAFRSVLLGGVLTKSDAKARGYDIDDTCELCGAKGDSVYHRTYKCSATKESVEGVVPRWFWEEAQKARPEDKFWVTASVPHPADLVPPPRTDYGSWAFDSDGCRCDSPSMHGNIFFDGSCSRSIFRGLQRASLALVQVDDNARAVKTVSVPVWATLPQTSQAAEYAAYAGLSHVLDARSTVYGDCQGVLDHAAADHSRRYDARRKYSGVLLSMRKYPLGTSFIERAVKVKAHQHIDSIADEDERWRAKGNDLADAAAKEARKRHPRPPAEVEAQIRFWESRAAHVVQAVATAMVQFPPLGGKLTRRPRAAKAAQEGPLREQVPVHQWEFAGGRWRCARCWTFVVGGGGVPAARRREACRSNRTTAQQEQFVKAGHLMLNTQGDLPITFCVKCGGWSSRRANRLGKICGPPTAAGKMALRRIGKGLHPWQARDAATGKTLSRGRLKIVRGPAKVTKTRATDVEEEMGPDALTTRGRKRGRSDEETWREHDAEAGKKRHVREAQLADGSDEPRSGARPMDEEDIVADVLLDGDGFEDVFGHGGSLDEPMDGTTRMGPALPEQGGDMKKDVQRSSGGEPPGYDEDGMRAAIRGASMPMLLTTMANTPSRFPLSHVTAVFNATSGRIVKVALGVIQDEIRRLRANGIKDADELLPDPLRDGEPGDTIQEKEDGGCAEPNGMSRDGVTGDAAPEPADEHQENGGTIFANREALIRHLTCGNAAASSQSARTSSTTSQPCGGRSGRDRGMKRGACEVAEIAKRVAVASSTAICAVGTRAGPGDPLRDARVTAAAASHQCGVAAAAVTADRMVAELVPEDFATSDPPNGGAAPLDGKENTEGTRPRSTSPTLRPTSPARGQATHLGALNNHITVEGPLRESARRRDGADEPRSWIQVARCGADATRPGVGKGPSKGSAQGVLGARNECGGLRRRPGDEEMTIARMLSSAGPTAGEGGGQELLRDSSLHHLLDHPRVPQGCHSGQGPLGPGGPCRRLPSPAHHLPHEGRRRPRDPPRGGADQGVHVRAISPGAATRPSAADQSGDNAAARPLPPDGCTTLETIGHTSGASLESRGLRAESSRDGNAGTSVERGFDAAPMPIQIEEQPERAREIGGAEADRWDEPAAASGAMDEDGTKGSRATEDCGCVPAMGGKSIVRQSPTRRRITGKRRPAVVGAQGAAAGATGCTNSTPEGDRVHIGDAGAEHGDMGVSAGARTCVGGGFKRARLEGDCSVSRRIGSVDRSPARAYGEMNTKKSTYGCLSGRGAAGGAVQQAGAAAAAALPSTQCTRPGG